MTAFRTRILSFAGATLAFAGVAFGQATCANPVSAGNFIRTESRTDKVADLYITCTNNTGVAIAAGSSVTDITVYSNLPITSKLLQTAPSPAVQYTEALAGNTAIGSTTLTAANSVQGVTTGGTQMTFLNVPTPAVAAGASYLLVITNIRVDASSISSTTPTPITFNVFINTAVGATPAVGATVLSNVTLAFAQAGLTSTTVQGNNSGNNYNGTGAPTLLAPGTATANAAPGNFPVCSAVNGQSFDLTFGEAFPNSFKIQGGTPPNATLGAAESNNTETGYQPTGGFPNVGAAGANLATSGTRVQINFAGIPAGVAVYVPNFVDGNLGFAGPSVLTYTTSATGAFTAGTATTDGGVPANFIKLPVSGGTAIAVYEVTAENPGAIDNFTVQVWTKSSANAVATTAVGTAITAQVTFAPIGSAGSIPNFIVGAESTVVNGNTYSLCTTTLLFPFVTNQLGFDTGLAISNTSTDNLKNGGGNSVTASTGSCVWNFFGSGAPAAPVTTAPLASGATSAVTLSSLAPGFQGYATATCNFLYAHGFAYLAYNLTQNNGTTMGYLSLVVPVGRPSPGPENLNN